MLLESIRLNAPQVTESGVTTPAIEEWELQKACTDLKAPPNRLTSLAISIKIPCVGSDLEKFSTIAGFASQSSESSSRHSSSRDTNSYRSESALLTQQSTQLGLTQVTLELQHPSSAIQPDLQPGLNYGISSQFPIHLNSCSTFSGQRSPTILDDISNSTRQPEQTFNHQAFRPGSWLPAHLAPSQPQGSQRAPPLAVRRDIVQISSSISSEKPSYA